MLRPALQTRWWLAAGGSPGAAAAAPTSLGRVYAEHQLKNVPRLPIPGLAESCERYVRALEPVQGDAEHAASRAAAAEFVRTGGPLQQALVDADAALPPDSSYLESTWYRAAYLAPRDPVVINANPGMVIDPGCKAALPPASVASAQQWQAAVILAGCARFVEELRAGTLPAYKHCMNFYRTVFGSARLPEAGCDRYRTSDSARHVAVWRGGAWFELPILTPVGAALPADALLAALKELPEGGGDAPAVCGFTADERDSWAANRAALWGASEDNRRSLESIDTALCAQREPNSQSPDAARAACLTDSSHLDAGAASCWTTASRRASSARSAA